MTDEPVIPCPGHLQLECWKFTESRETGESTKLTISLIKIVVWSHNLCHHEMMIHQGWIDSNFNRHLYRPELLLPQSLVQELEQMRHMFNTEASQNRLELPDHSTGCKMSHHSSTTVCSSHIKSPPHSY